MLKTATGLIDFAKSKIGTPYIYGAKGQILSRSQIQSLQNQYGKSYIWDSDLNKAGKVAVDCSGLISWYTGIIRGSTAYKSSALQMIPITTRSESNRGWAVWRQGHIGIYLGNNQYIAADGSAYGVRIAMLNQNNFTHLLKLSDIEYEEGMNKDFSLYGEQKTTVDRESVMNPGTYMLVTNLNVRSGAGINFPKKNKTQLSMNGQQCSNAAGTLLAGTLVTVKNVITNGSNIWGKIPSGYICLKEGNHLYVR